ncbi:hypothetical protein K474DRAFT_1667110 [Panus rudis PR-1116 ss-1]|nr:hypothetical protein K474DRAFT_1667110 [Panus rudis PR-1116 ss-1]
MTNPETPTPGHVLGASLLEIAVAFFLYGISVAQAYSCAVNFPRDPKWIKAMVAVVIALETAFSAGAIQAIYHETIGSFDDMSKIDLVPWGAEITAFAQAAIILICQGFYIHRVWILSNRKIYLVVFLTILLIAHVALEFISTAVTNHTGTWHAYEESHTPRVSVNLSNGIGAASDGAIVASLVYYLRKNRSHIKRTDNVLQRIVIYTINTGVLTMLVCIALAITFSLSTDTLAFTGLLTVVGRLYANSLLGTLNMRRVWSRGFNSEIVADSNWLAFSDINEPISAQVHFAARTSVGLTATRDNWRDEQTSTQ